MQSLLDDSAPLVLESLPTAKLELGATLVQGREEYYAARTSAEELRRSNLVCTELAMCDVRASLYSHVGDRACCLIVVIC